MKNIIKFEKKIKINNYKIILLLIILILFFSINFQCLKKLFICLFDKITKNNITKLFNNNQYKFDTILLMIPHHGNLGDQAITLAEFKFLKEIFPNIKLFYNLENYKNSINKNTIIFLQGGGNIGWTYYFEEQNRRKIIESYPNNNIVIMPQTIFFEETNIDQQEISSQIYNNHSKLIIIVREQISYNIAIKIFYKNKILLCPDIVTYLDDLINVNNSERKGALLILRNDIEKSLNKNIENQIIALIKNAYNKYDIIDNKFELNISSLEQSRNEVFQQLKKISSYEIVITDRLHGMIFSAITKTSCIVFKNYNHKIISSYEWFKNLDYIQLINNSDINEMTNVINYFKNKKTSNIYDKQIFNHYYNTIRETIINLK